KYQPDSSKAAFDRKADLKADVSWCRLVTQNGRSQSQESSNRPISPRRRRPTRRSRPWRRCCAVFPRMLKERKTVSLVVVPFAKCDQLPVPLNPLIRGRDVIFGWNLTEGRAVEMMALNGEIMASELDQLRRIC